MTVTRTFRNQHVKINAAIKDVETLLDEAKLKTDPLPVVKALSILTALLRIHLAMEDSSFYPSLASSESEMASATAKRFMTEMMQISQNYFSYSERWTPSNVEENPSSFCQESRQIFETLNNRIKKEEEVLYPLADTLSTVYFLGKR